MRLPYPMEPLMQHRPALDLADAQTIGAAALEHARNNQGKVSIAICDDGGHLLWFARMDGAPPMSAQIAPGKADCAARARKASGVLEKVINEGRTAALKMPVLTLEGGEMIVVDGVCVGAVGVSGVKSTEDADIARAGIAAIGAATSF